MTLCTIHHGRRQHTVHVHLASFPGLSGEGAGGKLERPGNEANVHHTYRVYCAITLHRDSKHSVYVRVHHYYHACTIDL